MYAWLARGAALLVLLTPVRSGAQGLPAAPVLPIAKTTVDVAGWLPSASISAAGERGGVLGTPIDFNDEFGLGRQSFLSVRLALRPTRRQQLSMHFVPIRYEMTATLDHDITFAGARYEAGMETNAVVSWLALGGAYRYDIVARPRLRVGLRGEIERTNVQVSLRNGREDEITSSSVATLPAGGVDIDLALSARSSVAFALVGLYVPDRTDQQFAYGGHYYDGRIDWRWRLTPHLSAQAGYGFIDIRHLGQADSGTLRLHGLMIGVAVSR